MRKGIKGICLTAVLLLALVFPAAVQAEERQGASGWKVTFNGRSMESNFTTANIGDEINAMEPGDSVEFTITLGNDFDGQADWYMKNEVLEALEDAGDAEGGAYDYLLTYTDTKGDVSTLYSSEKFGGDGRINGVGLHGATTTLENYFYLDRMGKNDTGVVKLKVALDGETLVNDYQNTAAKLQMDFATQLVRTTSRPGQDNEDNKEKEEDEKGDSSGQRLRVVKTGDEVRVLVPLVILFTTGLILLVIALAMLSKKQKKDAKKQVRPGRI